jgi:hypothetical protein
MFFDLIHRIKVSNARQIDAPLTSDISFANVHKAKKKKHHHHHHRRHKCQIM